MERIWAKHFYEIETVLGERTDIVEEMVLLIEREPIHAKVLEGKGRQEKLKEILIEVVRRKRQLKDSYIWLERQLGRVGSSHEINNRVFPNGWGERVIRDNFSRFYNHAVMNLLLKDGHTKCYIPVSPYSDMDSKCSHSLSDGEHEIYPLLASLVDTYSNGNYSNKNPRIPDHPHCTHVVHPVVAINL